MAFKMNYNRSSFPFKGGKDHKVRIAFNDPLEKPPSHESSTTKVHMGPNLTIGQKELISSVNRNNPNSDSKEYIESKKNIKYGKHKIPRTNEEIVGFYGPGSVYQDKGLY